MQNHVSRPCRALYFDSHNLQPFGKEIFVFARMVAHRPNTAKPQPIAGQIRGTPSDDNAFHLTLHGHHCVSGRENAFHTGRPSEKIWYPFDAYVKYYLISNERQPPNSNATVLRLTLFGKTRDGKSFVRHVVDAIGFALYLPGVEMTLAAKLYSPDVGERQMLFEHLDKLRHKDPLVLDRGYPACWLFAALLQRGRHFCMRADSLNFNAIQAFRRSGLVEQIVTLPAPGKQDALDYEIAATPCEVRLIRQMFGHKARVLVTSLLDFDAFPAGKLGALYHSRWRIEEEFKRIKHRLSLEQLSGMSWLTARQNFGAKILCDNLNPLAVHAASESLDPHTRARYVINRGDTFSRLKRTLGRWLLQGLDALDNVASVFDELIKNLVQARPN